MTEQAVVGNDDCTMAVLHNSHSMNHRFGVYLEHLTRTVAMAGGLLLVGVMAMTVASVLGRSLQAMTNIEFGGLLFGICVVLIAFQMPVGVAMFVVGVSQPPQHRPVQAVHSAF